MILCLKNDCSNSLPPDQFIGTFARMCPKDQKEKSETLETLGERVVEFWLPGCWRRQTPPPPQ